MKVTCPKCKSTQECSLYTSMNVSINPELKEYFVSNKWNILNCDNCGNISLILSDMMYHDMSNKFIVWYDPKNVVDSEYIKDMNRYDSVFKKLKTENYFSKPIIVKDRGDAIFMVHLCDKNGPPKTERRKNEYYRLIKDIREFYKGRDWKSIIKE